MTALPHLHALAHCRSIKSVASTVIVFSKGLCVIEKEKHLTGAWATFSMDAGLRTLPSAPLGTGEVTVKLATSRKSPFIIHTRFSLNGDSQTGAQAILQICVRSVSGCPEEGPQDVAAMIKFLRASPCSRHRARIVRQATDHFMLLVHLRAGCPR